MLTARTLMDPAAPGVQQDGPVHPRTARPGAEPGWTLLGGVGVAFILLGGLDLALTWYPLQFGNPEWEFGTVTSTLDGMPVYVLGLTLLLVAVRRRWLVRSVVVLALVTVLATVTATLLYATTVPMALNAITDPLVRLGLKKAILKTSVQGLVYSVVLTWLAVRSWRQLARR